MHVSSSFTTHHLFNMGALILFTNLVIECQVLVLVRNGYLFVESNNNSSPRRLVKTNKTTEYINHGSTM